MFYDPQMELVDAVRKHHLQSWRPSLQFIQDVTSM